MLEFDRIDVSEGRDINKIVDSCECIICKYHYFVDKNLKYNHVYVMVVMIY